MKVTLICGILANIQKIFNILTFHVRENFDFDNMYYGT